MDACLIYKNGVGVRAGSHNVVSCVNMGAGLWDVIFAYTSRTADTERFLIQAHTALGAAGFGYGTVTGIGASTITVRVAIWDTIGPALADLSFNCTVKEMG